MLDKKIFTVKVIPRAKQNAVIMEENTLFQEKILKIRTTAIPEKGKANQTVISILADYFNVKKSAIQIISGATSTTKIICVEFS